MDAAQEAAVMALVEAQVRCFSSVRGVDVRSPGMLERV